MLSLVSKVFQCEHLNKYRNKKLCNPDPHIIWQVFDFLGVPLLVNIEILNIFGDAGLQNDWIKIISVSLKNVSLTVLDRRSRVGDGAVNLVTAQITGGCTSHMEPGNVIKILGLYSTNTQKLDRNLPRRPRPPCRCSRARTPGPAPTGRCPSCWRTWPPPTPASSSAPVSLPLAWRSCEENSQLNML